MSYRFLNTSSKDSNFVLPRNCFFASLTDWINSLFDIILRVSLNLFQSSRLKTTDFGLPSDVVINSTSGSSIVFCMVKIPVIIIELSLAKGWETVNNCKYSESRNRSQRQRAKTSCRLPATIDQ